MCRGLCRFSLTLMVHCLCPKSKLRGCIDRRSDFVLELQDMSKITTVLVPSEKNMANIHTKCLCTKDFKGERDAIVNAAGRM